MICPEIGRIASKKDSQLLGWVEKMESSKPQEDEIQIPQPQLMRQICMEHFLIPSKEIFLNGDFYETYDISTATDRLVCLYSRCYKQKVLPPGKYYNNLEISTMESLKEVYSQVTKYSYSTLFFIAIHNFEY